jgi:hypothetical protein
MPEHDQVRAGEPAAHPGEPAHSRAAVVHHRDAQPIQFEFGGLRGAPVGHVRAVVVPEHGGHRRVLGQFGQDRGRADVARVQDEVGAPQLLGHLRRAGPPAPRGVSIGQRDHPHEAILPRRRPRAAGLRHKFLTVPICA